MTIMQRAVALIYPDQCAVCSNLIDTDGGLCASCWRETRFTSGLTCDLCATPLLGENIGAPEICDECSATARPWSKGRAAFYYSGVGRRIVLSLKYGDRTDLARPASTWMARAASDILTTEAILLPIPSHWTRLLRRRYNPAVELANALGRMNGLRVLQDGLHRSQSTRTQEGLGYAERFSNLENAFQVNARRKAEISGNSICIVDDTFTSGATLTAAATSVLEAGAKSVSVLVLARTLKNT